MKSGMIQVDIEDGYSAMAVQTICIIIMGNYGS